MIIKKNKFILVSLTITVILTYFGILTFNKLKFRTYPTRIKDDKEIVANVGTPVSCTRTTRLDNKPVYDRALSFIQEKYSPWDNEYLSGKNSYSYFVSQLVNCIKIDEGNLKNTTGEEAYFIFHGDQIKDNYYPITIDKDYGYNDEAINALLLVHEITHVQQYIDFLNGKNELSCIDKEVEAFHSQWNFYKFQFPEIRKTIDLRIQNDKKLNSTLQILKTIQDQVTFNFNEREDECLYGSGKTDVSKCVDIFDKNLIRDLLVQDEFYKKQCNL
jgi:hypothetical protein